jgi:hypothetical protein
MACGISELRSGRRFSIPSLTLTQPPRVTALTGRLARIGNVCHETTKLVVVIIQPRGVAAFGSQSGASSCPKDLPARGDASPVWQAWRSRLALGLVYAVNPLTSTALHGEAIALMLPHVVDAMASKLTRDRACRSSDTGIATNRNAADAIASF